MPAKSPKVSQSEARLLERLGESLRDQRKKLKLSSITTAEAAGISRVTLHRIERGEPSVAAGAYAKVVISLGLSISLVDTFGPKTEPKQKLKLPGRIRLDKYPQLKKMAWQLKAGTMMTPKDVLDLYERNSRHIDPAKLNQKEKDLLEAILKYFGRERFLV